MHQVSTWQENGNVLECVVLTKYRTSYLASRRYRIKNPDINPLLLASTLVATATTSKLIVLISSHKQPGELSIFMGVTLSTEIVSASVFCGNHRSDSRPVKCVSLFIL